MKRLVIVHIMLLASYFSISQGVGIGTPTPDASAALDITHTAKGLLIPRMTTPTLLLIPNPARGLLVYDSLINKLMVNIGTPAAPNWQPVAGNSGNGWNLNGNSGINPNNEFLGTTDNQPLRFRVNNIQAGELHPATGNIFWGQGAGNANTAGFSNIAIGTNALKFDREGTNLVAIGDSALFNNGLNNPVPGAFGISNTAVGSKSLLSNTFGSGNTAVGTNSLRANNGNENTAIGVASLFSNTDGGLNTAVGALALAANTTGNDNTATGWGSLRRNTTGVFNTALGTFTLENNTTAGQNTAIGFAALNFNTTGDNNTAAGQRVLIFNVTGRQNTGTGSAALLANVTGSFNTAIGGNALGVPTNSSNNTAVGFNAGFTVNLGSDNTLIGAGADASADGITNSVAIGKDARVTGNNQVRLGNAQTTSIGGIVGFTNLSDGRFKKDIQETVVGLDFIMKLRPVTYQLDIPGISKKLNGKINDGSEKSLVFSGFIAQEVEKAASDAGYDFSGVDKPKNGADMYGLRYAEFVVPLVKAIQEQQHLIMELKNQNAELQKKVAELEKRLR